MFATTKPGDDALLQTLGITLAVLLHTEWNNCMLGESAMGHRWSGAKRYDLTGCQGLLLIASIAGVGVFNWAS